MFAITVHFGQQLRETIGIAVTGSHNVNNDAGVKQITVK